MKGVQDLEQEGADDDLNPSGGVDLPPKMTAPAKLGRALCLEAELLHGATENQS